MAEFSYSDINDARRRVEEMRKRAQSYVGEENKESAPQPETRENKPNSNNFFDLLGSLSANDDSALILALILILSREKADNMLILALLYILL